MGYRVAVVGATGNVGGEMLQILAERKFPVDEVVALASERSTRQAGLVRRRAHARGPGSGELRLSRLRHRPVLAGRQGLGRIRAQGRRRRLRGDRQHLAVPHGPRRAAGRARGQPRARSRASTSATSSPTRTARRSRWSWRSSRCTTSPRIKRVVVATYQSVSGAGKEAMDELFEHTKAIYMNDRKEPVVLHEGDPVQRHPADRRVPGGRRDQGRVEDGGRDQEDPRPQDRRHRDLRARAGVRRPCRGDQCRVRERARRRRGARGAARGRGRGRGRRPRRVHHARSSASASMACSSRASARTRPCATA